ncbi:hypothetical protein OAN10_03365 [Alphaproteobacteria bacterium]|nr:hypothetical protein [Alphaproteobacteria bacterium]
MNKFVLILIFLVSFNSYARVYEYDIELIPIKDKNYHTCYNTILKIGDPNKILGISLEDGETCEEFLAFNEMIKDSHPEKARLPFHGQIKGINFEDRISFIEYYDHGQLNTIEYFKNGNLVNLYIPGEEIVSYTYRDDEKKTKLIQVYTKEKNMTVQQLKDFIIQSLDIYSGTLGIDQGLVKEFSNSTSNFLNGNNKIILSVKPLNPLSVNDLTSDMMEQNYEVLVDKLNIRFSNF